MSDLAARIAETIRAEGPIGVDRYWDMALFDPEGGYYTRADAIGRGGDFITAPEISQLFGELLGAWVAGAWQGIGRPASFVLAELGPGRGTLMADMVRTLRQVAPACLAAAKIRLIETSERMAARQYAALERFDLPVARFERLAETEAEPTIVVANEVFDAVAIRQYVHAEGEWRERRVGLTGDGGGFAFTTGPVAEGLGTSLARGGLPPPAEGAILELAPAREALAQGLATRIAAQGGAALAIDYGHDRTAYGDTLQAVRGHAHAPVLAEPGAADITSHVDFQRLARPFAEAGLAPARPVGQGAFLLAMGLLERAGQLGSPLDEAGRDAIREAVARLAGEESGQMGALFRVFGAASHSLALPPFSLTGGDGTVRTGPNETGPAR